MRPRLPRLRTKAQAQAQHACVRFDPLSGLNSDISSGPRSVADTQQLVASLLARYNFLQNHFDMTSAY
jgi:hypothetical protein